ncbi:MAG: hypothetical protein ACD_39C01390G0003 [uncultured bacterium]|nr:MAG: hypothetical protein ACD_39C01390G0003 [uncultured bacterium]
MRPAMVLTDLDGTFLSSDRTISAENLDVLHTLGQHGIVRVAATGRNLHSSREVLDCGLPFDYLIFSTGAGICRFADSYIMHKRALDTGDIHAVADFFASWQLDFSIHHPIPENHRFHWYASPNPTSDLKSRLHYLADFAVQGDYLEIKEATQLLAITLNGREVIEELQKRFSHLSIIRTTSPIDGKHTWIEVFPPGASKGSAAEWLCKSLSIEKERTMSIGNDFNDLAMLEWTQTSYVVANAAPELVKQFLPAPGNDDQGFAVATRNWLSQLLP